MRNKTAERAREQEALCLAYEIVWEEQGLLSWRVQISGGLGGDAPGLLYLERKILRLSRAYILGARDFEIRDAIRNLLVKGREEMRVSFF